jgi:hypothetical protein
MKRTGLEYTNTIRKACLGILQNGHIGKWTEYPKYIEFICAHCGSFSIIKQIKNDYKLSGDAHIIVCTKKS